MIQLHFVGDGDRDAVTVPELVQKILGCKIGERSQPWARLHDAGRGYERKLRFAMISAQADGADGLVVTIDRDKDHKGERIERLRQGRLDARNRNLKIPTALGQAIPHGEAWLLDDPVAVKTTLELPESVETPSVLKTKSPKTAMESMLAGSRRAGQRPLQVWADIAEKIELSRYQHAQETGFKQFAEDVESELRGLVVA